MMTNDKVNIEDLLKSHKQFAKIVDEINKSQTKVDTKYFTVVYTKSVRLEFLMEQAIGYDSNGAPTLSPALETQRRYTEQLKAYAQNHGITIEIVSKTMMDVCAKDLSNQLE